MHLMVVVYCVQANLAIQEGRLNAAMADLNAAQAQLDEKEAELAEVQAQFDKAMAEKQVRGWQKSVDSTHPYPMPPKRVYGFPLTQLF